MQHLWDLGHGWIRALIGGRAVGLLVLTQLLGALVFVAPASQAEEIHKEKSLYRNIIVREGDGRRCLLFSVKRGERSQTCMDLQDPRRLVFAYARMSLGGLLVNPNPARVLVIGGEVQSPSPWQNCIPTPILMWLKLTRPWCG